MGLYRPKLTRMGTVAHYCMVISMSVNSSTESVKCKTVELKFSRGNSDFCSFIAQ